MNINNNNDNTNHYNTIGNKHKYNTIYNIRK